MSRAALIIAVLALSACAKSEEASLVPPQEEGYNMVDPVGARLAAQDEVALGEWTNATVEERPALQFGPPQAGALFSMRCGDEGAVLLQRYGVISGPGLNMMAVEIGGAVERLPAEAVGGAIPVLRATLPAGAALLPRLQQPQGRITVRAGEGEPLIMPSSPLIGSFVASCAAGPQPAAEQTGAEGGGNVAAPGNAATPAAPSAPGNSAAATPSTRTPG